MNTIRAIGAPTPLIRERRTRYGNGAAMIVGRQHRGDYFNLTTGDIWVARIINGVRYDTARATLIAGEGDWWECSYQLRRLYRADHGGFFVVQMEWAEMVGIVGLDFIHVLPHSRVLTVARSMIADRDYLTFLRDWYCCGWLPRDDSFARAWAEQVLSADYCEVALAEIAKPNPPAVTRATTDKATLKTEHGASHHIYMESQS